MATVADLYAEALAELARAERNAERVKTAEAVQLVIEAQARVRAMYDDSRAATSAPAPVGARIGNR